MKVKPEEEQRVRNAGKLINEKLRSFKDQFGIDDKEDLLAMVAFDSMIAKMKVESEVASIDSTTSGQLDQLENIIKTALS
ncbi:cell division protein ZapA [Roseivirga sp.]|uniref:cell division protein ZapA n=1 Tax=Roseivirga sp. TaxID=1964215 RepID=UPI003A5C8889